MSIVLTGDRPTGALHLGHLVGSLMTRIELQSIHKQYVMIADLQALTDNNNYIEDIKTNIIKIILDYLAVGIDPQQTTIFLQSSIKALNELFIFYLNLVTIARLQRNPTVKNEIIQKQYQLNIPAGFLTYPISQAADITAFKADIVPVGEDQLPIIEQTNEIIRKFNTLYKTSLPQVKALLSNHPRLVGIDGKNKMSKSLSNAIFLTDDNDAISRKVMRMYTDSHHIKINDPGNVEGNVVFSYLDVFETNKSVLQKMKEYYTQGGLADTKIKKHLIDVLEDKLTPIRERYKIYAGDKSQVLKILKLGTEKANDVANDNLKEIRSNIGLLAF